MKNRVIGYEGIRLQHPLHGSCLISVGGIAKYFLKNLYSRKGPDYFPSGVSQMLLTLVFKNPSGMSCLYSFHAVSGYTWSPQVSTLSKASS